jgi:proteic killer suppression protein
MKFVRVLIRGALVPPCVCFRVDALGELAVPPGNRLEPLRGDRIGQHSIRINDQWRICFEWTDAGPEGVEIIDYH